MSELFLEELVSHGNEGDRESTAEEEDEVNCQLVSETSIFLSDFNFNLLGLSLTCC